MIHLEDKQYYIDLFDRFTVEGCRKYFFDGNGNKIKDRKELSLARFGIYCYSGERYEQKEEVIAGWMNEDRRKDQLLAQKEPLVYCPRCLERMKLVIKEIDYGVNSDDSRVMYLYKCDPCKEKRGIYSDGSPYIFKADLCPKCNSEWESIHKKTKGKITTTSECKGCEHVEIFTLDLSLRSGEKKIDPNFEADRKEYCLSAEKGMEYIINRNNFKRWMEISEDEEKYKIELEKAKKAKILSIAELSQLLSKKLVKAGYSNLAVSNPEIGRDLVVGFTVQDIKADRAEHDSTRKLKKLLSDMFENTNWHLMSEGIRYKLGILSGRLRGQDSVKHIYEYLKDEIVT